MNISSVTSKGIKRSEVPIQWASVAASVEDLSVHGQLLLAHPRRERANLVILEPCTQSAFFAKVVYPNFGVFGIRERAP